MKAGAQVHCNLSGLPLIIVWLLVLNEMVKINQSLRWRHNSIMYHFLFSEIK